MYRDELEQTRKRVEELDVQLEVQRRELAELRAHLDRRGRPPAARGPRRAVVMSALGLTLAAGAGAWVAHRSTAATTPASAGSIAPRVIAAAGLPAGGAPAGLGAAGVGGLGSAMPRVELPTPAAVDELAARCARPIARDTFDGLPEGTATIDLGVCGGCDCCEPEGAFPVVERQDGGLMPDRRCEVCSRNLALGAAGIGVYGTGLDGHLSSARGRLAFTLASPTRVFGARLRGRSAGFTADGPRADPRAVLVAYDDAGRSIDAAMTTSSFDDEETSTREDRVLLVQACEGEAIARVELITEASIEVRAIAK